MDSLTQATLGASVGHLCWHTGLGRRRALVIGAACGTLPDLDILLYPFLNDVQRLYWHRGESHSIWFVLVAGLLTSYLIRKSVWGMKLSTSRVTVGALLIYATHILIDLFTVYGTQLFAPLSRMGYALGNLFIVDPLVTIPLLTGCLGAALMSPRAGNLINQGGLSLAACYMLWSLFLQNVAENTFQQRLADEHETIIRQRTTAAPFTTFLWRHIAETKDGFLLSYWSLFDDPEKPITFYHIPRRAELVKDIQQSPSFETIQWFSQGWWCAIEGGENHRGKIQVIDLRFSEIVSSPDLGYTQWQYPFSWSFDPRVKESSRLYSILPQVDSPLNVLHLLFQRIGGGREWYSRNFLAEANTTSQAEPDKNGRLE